MSKLHSKYRALIKVALPGPTKGRQHYMHTFDLTNPTVPKGFEDYLPAVEALCKAAGATHGIAHLTIDEKVVKAGMSQRRPKPHVDGCFVRMSEIPGGGWYHGGSSGWLHNCNNITTKSLSRMPVIVAASEVGCRVWEGDFDGTPASDGDLSHIADQLGEGLVVPANHGYLLGPDCIHESMIMDKDTPRTFIRIALPNNINYGV